jgi:isopenicillin-N N-acyltransferase-like protein
VERVTLPRIRVKGSRYTMGVQYGGACASQIRSFRDASLAHLEQFGGLTVDQGLARAETFLDRVRAALPGLAEEVRGIADGAGIRLVEAALLQVRYEVVNLPAGLEGCTIVGVERDRSAVGSPLVAQNIDVPASNVPLLVMLHLCPDDGPQVLTCTMAGILAQTGLNSAGLGLCGSFVVSANWRFAVPSRNFIRRHILERASLEDAIAVMTRFPARASGHNVMVTDGSGRVADIESTPDEFRVLRPSHGVMAHTNHYCHPDLAPCDALSESSLGDFAEDSHRRLRRVHALLDRQPDRISPWELRALLSDHEGYPKSVCRHPDGDPTQTQSACSVVLAPALRQMSVAAENPCLHAPVDYEL